MIMDEYLREHTSILVGDDVYIWGGFRSSLPSSLPYTHDSPEKRQLLSSVDVLNILNASVVKRPTTGTPPNGAIDYGSCSVGDDIYYFGGRCDDNCCHNDLLVLNTTSKKWSQIMCNNGPMEKYGCRMIPFSISGEDHLLVINGYGPLPSNPPSHAQYSPDPNKPSRCFTNEAHIMCVSTTPGKWTVPVKTGSVFPPSAHFSINTLPGNRAIVFGGVCINEHNKRYYSNDVFIVSYTNNTVDFQRLDHFATNVPWPKGRCGYSSVVISSVSGNGEEKHYLLVLGGLGTPDCWLMEITNNYQWKQISVPEVVTKRFFHSMSCYNMSDHCKWLIVSGGELISSPNRLMVVELVFSPTDDNWTVTNVLNEEDMKNTTTYTKLVSDHLSEWRGRNEYQKRRRTVPVYEQASQQEDEKHTELTVPKKDPIQSIALPSVITADCPTLDRWDYGIRIDVDPGTLSSGSCVANVNVLGDTIQSLAIPKEYDPISAVYSVSLSDPSARINKIRMQHHVSDSKQLDKLSFLRKPSDQPTPGQWVEVSGGMYGKKYGEISPQQDSQTMGSTLWSIVGCLKKLFVRAPSDKYKGMVLYVLKSPKMPSVWLMQLLVTKHEMKNILSLKQYIRNKYGDDQQPTEGLNFSFTFEKSEKPKLLALLSFKCDNGWEIAVDVHEITQVEADSFENFYDTPGGCKMEINTYSKPSNFEQQPIIALKGINSDLKHIQVDPPINTAIEDKTRVFMQSKISDSFGDVPTISAVYQLLLPYSSQWDTIGQKLGVSYNDRMALHHDMSREANSKLESIIVKWIESMCSPVTWDNLIGILGGLHGGYTRVNMIQSDALKELREGMSTNEEIGNVPTLSAVYHLLSPFSAHWNTFGAGLGVPYNDREVLYHDVTKGSSGKLRCVIQKWIESECSLVTWDNLTRILDRLGYTIVVKMIHSALSESREGSTNKEISVSILKKTLELHGYRSDETEEINEKQQDNFEAESLSSTESEKCTVPMKQQYKDHLMKQITHYKNLWEAEQKKSLRMAMEIEKLKEKKKIGAADVDPEEYSPMKEGYLDNSAVHVGGETVYLIQGRSVQSFNWSEWGLRIHFPEDCLAPSPVDVVSSGPAFTPPLCSEVAVKALVGGKFQFPQGSELVSAVYAISLANKLKKPVQLEIQHCAMLKSERQFKQLTFMRAPMRRVLPFVFSPLEGGEFSVNNEWGSITLDHFSLIAIVLLTSSAVVGGALGGMLWNKYARIQGGPAVNAPLNPIDAVRDDDEVDLKYSAQLVYSRYGNRMNQWSVWFMAMKDINALQTYLQKKHPTAELSQLIPFNFDGNNGVLKLIIEDKVSCNGWTLTLDVHPLKIRQKQINKFGREAGIPEPPSCLIRATVSDPKTAEDLHHSVPIEGVDCDMTIFINRSFEKVSLLSKTLDALVGRAFEGREGVRYGSFTVILMVLIVAILTRPWIMHMMGHSEDNPKSYTEIMSDISLNKDLETFCVNLGLLPSKCEEIVLSNSGNYNAQILRIVKLWGDTKTKKMNDFIVALDKTGYCAKAKELAEDHKLEYLLDKCTSVASN